MSPPPPPDVAAAAPRRSRRSLGLLLHGLAVFALTTAVIATTTGWPARLPLHLGLFLAAGATWALTLLRLAPRAGALGLGAGGADRAVLAAIALAIRVPAWLAAPAHSDDVYRYAWDGRVSRAGINPYRHPPSAPALDFLRGGERGSARIAAAPAPVGERAPARPSDRDAPLSARVNNPDLPTIYPPGAQLAFFAAALLPGPPLVGLKIVLGAADLAVMAFLVALLRRRGADARFALAWGWSPLVAVELGQNAHLDALPLLGLVAALLAWESGRRTLAGALLGLATATKLVTLPLFGTAFRSLRGWAAGLAVMVACALPFVGAGAALAGSTGEFARRWRSNDGAYALVQGASDRLVCRALDAPPAARQGAGPRCDRALDLWPHVELARLITGRRHRAAVYPDELSAFAARGAVALLAGMVLLGVALRRTAPLAAAEWTFGVLLLFTPALHPWYATWLLPLAALTRRPAWIALAVLVPLGYLPLGAWLAGAPWRDPVWTRIVEHGACWGLLFVDLARAAGAKTWTRSARIATIR